MQNERHGRQRATGDGKDWSKQFKHMASLRGTEFKTQAGGMPAQSKSERNNMETDGRKWLHLPWLRFSRKARRFERREDDRRQLFLGKPARFRILSNHV